MAGMSAKVEKNELVVRIPLQKPVRSKSGKTLVVATSHGNQQTEALVGGKAVVIGLNAYVRDEPSGESSDE